MELLRINELDYRSILIENYKQLKLEEKEVVVLLLIDSISKEKMTLITGDQLQVKMNLDSKEIDEILVSLLNKQFLSYEQKDGILVTSMENTYKRIVELVKNRIVDDVRDIDSKEQEEGLTKVLKILEEEMKRSPSPLEVEMVVSWFKDGINENVIINSINECIMKSSRISVKQIDRILTKNLSHIDRVEEGFSTVDEKTKKDIKKAIEIASYDWVNKK